MKITEPSGTNILGTNLELILLTKLHPAKYSPFPSGVDTVLSNYYAKY
jgi:hypothetical protein